MNVGLMLQSFKLNTISAVHKVKATAAHFFDSGVVGLQTPVAPLALDPVKSRFTLVIVLSPEGVLGSSPW